MDGSFRSLIGYRSPSSKSVKRRPALHAFTGQFAGAGCQITLSQGDKRGQKENERATGDLLGPIRIAPVPPWFGFIAQRTCRRAYGSWPETFWEIAASQAGGMPLDIRPYRKRSCAGRLVLFGLVSSR